MPQPKRQIINGKKLCVKCKTWVETELFPDHKYSTRGVSSYSYCKPCLSIYDYETSLKRQHNITPQEADAILARQDNKCAICRKPQLKSPRRFAIDHDHSTGFIRGRLCVWCNRIISYFHDNPNKLQAAADYLRNPPAKQVIGDRIVKLQRKRRGGLKQFEPKEKKAFQGLWA